MNINTATKEMILPKEETIFQPKKASGKSLYLLGRPAKPKKCWGKKVKLHIYYKLTSRLNPIGCHASRYGLE